MLGDARATAGCGGSDPDSRQGFLAWLGRRLLSSGFELLYHELAPAYDSIAWLVSGGRWREWQRAALGEVPEGRVLEVGPGTGWLLLDLLAAGRDAVGLELSPTMLRLAVEHLGTRRVAGRLVRGDARRLPFVDGTFDAVLLTFPSPYIGAAFWSEVERVLRPEGRLVVVLQAASGFWPWPGALEWLLGRLVGGGTGSSEEISLAPRLRGRVVGRRRGGVVRLLLAERVS